MRAKVASRVRGGCPERAGRAARKGKAASFCPAGVFSRNAVSFSHAVTGGAESRSRVVLDTPEEWTWHESGLLAPHAGRA